MIRHIYFYNTIIFSLFLLLTNCQVNTKNHGILFLENRYNILVVNENNTNDVIKIVGNPHTKSISNENTWIYIERTLTKGKYYKLGQNVIKTNNVMVLTFDKYGVLKEKDFYDKKSIADIKFTKEVTENNLSDKSFVEEFLQSIRSKMYGGKR